MANFNEPDKNYNSDERILNLYKTAAVVGRKPQDFSFGLDENILHENVEVPKDSEESRKTLRSGIRDPAYYSLKENQGRKGAWYNALMSMIKNLDDLEVLTNTLYNIPETLGQNTGMNKVTDFEVKQELEKILRSKHISFYPNSTTEELKKRYVEVMSKDKMNEALDDYLRNYNDQLEAYGVYASISRSDIPEDIFEQITIDVFENLNNELYQQVEDNLMHKEPENQTPAIISNEVDYTFFKNSLSKYYSITKKLIDNYETLIKNFEHIDPKVWSDNKEELINAFKQGGIITKISQLRSFPNGQSRWSIHSFPFGRSNSENKLRANKINQTLHQILNEFNKFLPHLHELIKNVQRLRGGKVVSVNSPTVKNRIYHEPNSQNELRKEIASKSYYLFRRPMKMKADFY